jgi:putative sugar O-methyltransferase
MDQIISKKLDKYKEYLEGVPVYADVSDLWKAYRFDFKLKEDPEGKKRFSSGLRNYGINTKISETKIDIYFAVSRLADRFVNRLAHISLSIAHGIVSLSIFGKTKTPIYLDSSRGNPKSFLLKESHNCMQRYLTKFKSLGWKYSLNSFKSFYYFYKLEELTELESFCGKNILEIGSGMCNFAMILMDELDEFNYICLDLPELVPAAYLSISKYFRSNNIEVFLPHELEASKASASKRKLTFITPEQLKYTDICVDLFINHESFAEMRIETVNSYLDEVKKIANSGAIFYLVNRLCRQTDRNSGSYNTYTFFDKYDLGSLATIYKEIDELRTYRMGRETGENVIYLGRCVKH